jgi:hypothetical protein
VVVQYVVNNSTLLISPPPYHFKLQHAISQQLLIVSQIQEARIILAIEAIRIFKKLNYSITAQFYNILYSIFINKINNRFIIREYPVLSLKLTKLEEDIIIRYIFDIDKKGFAPRITSIEDIANYILESQGV